jgi:gluconolactonase
MRSALLLTGAAIAVLCTSDFVPSAHLDTKKTFPPMGTIQREDPLFDQLVPQDAKIEKLADGFDWAEGPVWIKEEGCLLFSDIPKNSIFKWKEGH